MKRIESFPFQRMTNALASQVYSRMLTPLLALNLEQLKAIIEKLETTVTAFTDAMRQPVASVISRRLAELDPERDRMLTELFRNVKNSLQSHDSEVRNAADYVDVELRLYGNPANRTMDEQTRVMDKMLRDLLADDMVVHFEKLPIAHTLVKALLELNNQFSEEFNQRLTERESIIVGLTEQNRRASDEAIREMVDVLNAYAIIAPSEELSAAMVSINAILDDARVTFRNRRRGRNEAGEVEDVEEVEN